MIHNNRPHRLALPTIKQASKVPVQLRILVRRPKKKHLVTHHSTPSPFLALFLGVPILLSLSKTETTLPTVPFGTSYPNPLNALTTGGVPLQAQELYSCVLPPPMRSILLRSLLLPVPLLVVRVWPWYFRPPGALRPDGLAIPVPVTLLLRSFMAPRRSPIAEPGRAPPREEPGRETEPPARKPVLRIAVCWGGAAGAVAGG
jgi:hypothetical protein